MDTLDGLKSQMDTAEHKCIKLEEDSCRNIKNEYTKIKV